MLTMPQRQQIANQMTAVREKLRSLSPDMLVSELHPDLQKAVRSFPMLGPITSSGLEHVYQIFNRLDFTISGLLNPNYDVDEKGKQYRKVAPPPPAQQAQPVSPAPIQPPATPQPATKQSTDDSTNQTNNDTVDRLPQLNFGPFDPRKDPDAKS